MNNKEFATEKMIMCYKPNEAKLSIKVPMVPSLITFHLINAKI